MKSRYCYCPMTARKIGRRVTIIDRLRKWNVNRKRVNPDLYRVTGFNAPVYPGK